MFDPKLSIPTLLLAALASGCTGEPPSCAEGAEACACRASAPSCDDGLACVEGACAPLGQVRLSVGGADVRACEVLLRDGGAAAVGARFSGTAGTTLREAPLTAVTFTAEADSPLGEGAVRILVQGTGVPEVVRSRCFDRSGVELPAATVQVGG